MPPAVEFVPKDRFTSLDTRAVARELAALGRAWVDKAFGMAPDGFAITIRSGTMGRRELVIVPGRYSALVPGPLAHDEELTPSIRDLRRLLGGAELIGASARPGERTLELGLRRSDTGEAPVLLAAELFGRGNLVVAHGGRLRFVLHPRSYAHRSLRVGAAYEPPPERPDPWATSEAALESVLRSSRTDRASTLASRLSLGGPLAEELLARAGLPGDRPATESVPAATAAIATQLKDLLHEVDQAEAGYVYRGPIGLLDVTPFRARRWTGVAGVVEHRFPSFSEGALEYFREFLAVPSEREQARQREMMELTRQREQQQGALSALGDESARRRAEADAIYAHLADAEAARAASEASPERPVEIPVVLAGVSTSLRRGRSAMASANALYEEVKKLEAKIAGTRLALAETERKLETLSARIPEAGPEAPRVRVGAVPGRPRWFERFRWFVSSEGILVLAGRDAASNDLVVRRHLKERDRYVHADVHGAASVVVKHPEGAGTDPGEATMLEAGQWAVCFSKIWRAGHASGAAFWVEADQVSKAGESGEFVARGSWAIRGTKHRMDDLPVELAIGTVDYEGEARWVAAPRASFRVRGQLRFLLTPDAERYRPEREVELARELGVPRDRLQSLLPAGGFGFRRP